MKRLKLDNKFIEKVVEGERGRLDKATSRGMPPAQIQALTNFATKIRTTIDEQRDTSNTTTSNNTQQLEEKIDILGKHLSTIVARVQQYRNDTKLLEEPFKPPHNTSQETAAPLTNTNKSQIDGIFKKKRENGEREIFKKKRENGEREKGPTNQFTILIFYVVLFFSTSILFILFFVSSSFPLFPSLSFLFFPFLLLFFPSLEKIFCLKYQTCWQTTHKPFQQQNKTFPFL
jgi:hypothetical protein